MKSVTKTTNSASNSNVRSDFEKDSAAQTWRKIVPFALVFLASCFILFANLGKYPLFNPDEALYAEPAREMLDTGEYITTLLNYKVRFTKPPLVIWAMALSFKVFGVNEFAARCVGAAAGALLIAFTYLFAEKYINRRTAIIAALMLATAPLYVGCAREAITDMPLALFFAGSLMSFFHAYKTQNNKLLFLGYILVGLAVMTKGPVGLLLPALIMAAFYFTQGNIKNTLSFYKPILGAIIVGAIALPWFVVEIAITKGAYYQEFLVRENFQRFTSVVDSHKGGWWYHIVAMFVGFLPWSIFSVVGLLANIKNLTVKKFAFSFETIKKWWREPIGNWDLSKQLLVFTGLWTFITLVFFSSSVSKLISYTLPAFPALAMLTAWFIDKTCSNYKKANIAIPYVILALAFGIMYSLAPLIMSKAKGVPTHDLLFAMQSFASFELAVLLIAGIVLAFKKPITSFVLFFALTSLSTLYFANRTLNFLSDYWEEPLPQYANYAGQSNWPIMVFDMRKPSIPFYCLRQVELPNSKENLFDTLSLIPRAYILTKASNRDYFQSQSGYKILSAKGNFLLMAWQNDKLKANLKTP